MSETTINIFIAVFTALLASSGFWAYILRITEKNSLKSSLLIGLAHDRIVYLGLKYIERGWITKDEYENLRDYLYKPYAEIGGNGAAKRIMNEVDRLPICKNTLPKENCSQENDYE